MKKTVRQSATEWPTPADGSAVAVVVDGGKDVEFFDCEQGSEEWFTLRLGMPTASNFSTIMASGKDGGASKTRAKLLRQLAGEILTGVPAETYSNAHMQRGKDMEAEIRENYAFTRGVEPTLIGFVRRALPRGRFVGCSPDSLIGDDGVLEVKTMIPDLMIELVDRGMQGFPSEHRAQCQGSLWVTGRSWCDLRIGYRGMPITPTFRVERDDVFIKEISEAVEVFDYDLRKLVERIRNMSGRTARGTP